jgi:hypothetical protein
MFVKSLTNQVDEQRVVILDCIVQTVVTITVYYAKSAPFTE